MEADFDDENFFQNLCADLDVVLEYEETFEAILDSLHLPNSMEVREFLKKHAMHLIRGYPPQDLEPLLTTFLSRMSHLSLIIFSLILIQHARGVDRILAIREQSQKHAITFSKIQQINSVLERISINLATSDIFAEIQLDKIDFILRQGDICAIEDMQSTMEIMKAECDSELYLIRMIDWDLSCEEQPPEFRYLRQNRDCVSASVIGPYCARTYGRKKFGFPEACFLFFVVRGCFFYSIFLPVLSDRGCQIIKKGTSTKRLQRKQKSFKAILRGNLKFCSHIES